MIASPWRRLGQVALFCCLVIESAELPARAETFPNEANAPFSVGTGFDFASGTYGSDTRTDFLAVPLIVDYYPTDRIDLELIIPYVYQSNSSTVYGTVMPYRRGGFTGATAAVAGVQNGRFLSGPGSQSSGSSTIDPDSSQGGLGDITLTAGYVMVEDEGLLPRLRSTLYLKFPTADRDKGLGTGEFDAGPGLALSKWLGDWQPFLEGIYVFQGESDLYATKDYLNYNGGVGYQISDSFYGAVLAKGATAPADGSPAPFEGRIKFAWQFLSTTSLEGYFSKGFSDGSPEVGAGLAVFYSFGQ